MWTDTEHILTTWDWSSYLASMMNHCSLCTQHHYNMKCDGIQLYLSLICPSNPLLVTNPNNKPSLYINFLDCHLPLFTLAAGLSGVWDCPAVILCQISAQALTDCLLAGPCLTITKGYERVCLCEKMKRQISKISISKTETGRLGVGEFIVIHIHLWNSTVITNAKLLQGASGWKYASGNI